MALAGIGVDIVEIPRMARALERTPSMRTRLFTKEETPDPQRDLAESFRKARSVLDELDTVEAQGAVNSGEETKVQDR